MFSQGMSYLQYIVVGMILITGGLRVHVAEGGDALALPKQLSVPIVIADTLLDRDAAELSISSAQEHTVNQSDSLGTDTNGEGSEKGDLSEVSNPLSNIGKEYWLMPAVISPQYL